MSDEQTQGAVQEPAQDTTPAQETQTESDVADLGDLEQALAGEGDESSPEGQSEETLPDSLKKFAGPDGKLDPGKLAQSYLELERSFRQLQNQMAQATTSTAQQTQDQTTSRDREALIQEFVQDPEGFLKRYVVQAVEPIRQQTELVALKTIHPELNDPEFAKGLGEFVQTLPPSVQAVGSTLDGASWLVSLYKERVSPQRGSQAPKPPSGEAPSGGRGPRSARKIRRSEIRRLILEDPERYERLLPQIERAYQEGRVIED